MSIDRQTDSQRTHFTLARALFSDTVPRVDCLAWPLSLPPSRSVRYYAKIPKMVWVSFLQIDSWLFVKLSMRSRRGLLDLFVVVYWGGLFEIHDNRTVRSGQAKGGGVRRIVVVVGFSFDD